MTIQYRQQAVSDLEQIKAWGIDQWGVARTDAFLAGLREAVNRLERFPELGRLRPAFHPRLRSIHFSGYAIFYTVEPEGPTVATILHERRNHAALDFSEGMEGDF